MLNESFSVRYESIKCFAIDINGTLVRGSAVLENALESVRRLQVSGLQILLHANNSRFGAAGYQPLLQSLGFEFQKEAIYTSAEASVEHLLNFGPGHRLNVLGTPALKQYFERSGFHLDSHRPDALIVGSAPEFSAENLLHCADLLEQGVPFYATHPDALSLLSGGGRAPDCGAFAAALQAMSGVAPTVLGKPSAVMMEGLIRHSGVSREQILVVGDQRATDIAGACRHGMLSTLVTTGMSDVRASAAGENSPDLVVSSLRELVALV